MRIAAQVLLMGTNVFAALVGAVVGGTFILAAQALDFRRRNIVAARLLLAEMKANASLARKMVETPAPNGYPQEGPSPAFFNTRVWESRAVLMPEFLDPNMIALLTEMYGIKRVLKDVGKSAALDSSIGIRRDNEWSFINR
jgi:hypothetical protein